MRKACSRRRASISEGREDREEETNGEETKEEKRRRDDPREVESATVGSLNLVSQLEGL